MFAIFSVNNSHSSSEILVRFVFVLVRSANGLLRELSQVCDSLSLQSADHYAKGKRVIQLVGVGYATLPFAQVAFATVRAAFAGIYSFS